MMLQARNDMLPFVQEGRNSSFLYKCEGVLLGLVMLGPLFGLLFPPEFYFSPQAATEFTASGAMAAPHEWITAFATHLTTLFTFFLIWRHREGYFRSLKYASLILLQFAAVLVTIIWSPDIHISLREFYHILILLMIAIYVTDRYSAVEFIALLTRLFTICGVLCLLSVVFFPQYSHSVGLVGYENAYRGLFINKNNLGSMCSSAVAFAAYSLLISAGSKRVALLCLGCALVLVVLSRSATSQLLVGFELIFLTIVYLIRSGLGRMVLIAGGVAGVLLACAVMTTVSDPFQLIGRSSTLTGRTDIWAAVVPLIDAKPLLGWGFGFWQFDIPAKNDIWAQLGWAAPHAHNDVLDILVQTGFFGLGFMALNMFSCIFIGRHVEDGSVMCLLFMLSFLIEGLTEALSLTDPARSTFILFCVQIYIWKLAFSAKALPAKRDRRVPNALAVIS
jgi:exopolysaccharide production protein ExoQ